MFLTRSTLLVLLPAFLTAVSAAPLSARGVASYQIKVKNNCAYPVWPAASQKDSPVQVLLTSHVWQLSKSWTLLT
jgi:hypothetical protein